MMLNRSMMARRTRAPLPTLVWSMTIESSITAPSLTHTDRPRIELRIVARLTRDARSEEHTSELQSQSNLVCRLLLEKKKKDNTPDDRPRHHVHYPDAA